MRMDVTDIVGGTPPLVSRLPATAEDGEEVDLLVDAGGTYGGPLIWRCRYRAATTGAYKWHVIGAAPLEARIETVIGTVSQTSYADIGGNVGPSVQLPAAGDYIIAIGATIAGGGDGNGLLMSYAIGATPASDQDNIAQCSQSATGSGNWYSVSGEKPKLGLGAVLLKAQYRVVGPVHGSIQQRWIRATPLRLG